MRSTSPGRSGSGDWKSFPYRDTIPTVSPLRATVSAGLTDFKTIGDAEVEKLRGVEVLVVNALRFTEHYSHFNVAEALALIARVAPREAYLTHMSHDIGLHAVTEPTLPRGVHMAYDTLQIEIND